MRKLQLDIAGRAADLPAGLKGLVRLTQARAALADLDSRVGEYSWPITLPNTRTNARIFGVNALHPLGLDKFRSVDFPYELRCEGQFFAGTFRLTSLKGGYTGQLLGDGFSWALLLGEKLLTDLRFAEVPYNGTQLAGILTQDGDETDLQFPLLSFGNFFAPPLQQRQADGSFEEVPNPAAPVLDYPLSVDDYPPGVYYRNVLRQIFAEIGWSLTGRVLDELQWRQTVLTCAGADVDKAWPWGALLQASASNGGVPVSSFSYFDGGPAPGYTNNAVGFNEAADGEIFFLPVPTPVVGSAPTRALNAPVASIRAEQAGTYTFAYTANISASSAVVDGYDTSQYGTSNGDGFRGVFVGLCVRRGGESFSDAGLCYDGVLRPEQDQVFAYRRITRTGVAGAASVGPNTGTASVFLEVGDSVNLCVFARRRLLDSDGLAVLFRREFTVTFSATSFACTGYSDNDGVSRLAIQPSAFLPPLSQKDVVRDFLKRTDTVPVADPARRIVQLLTRTEQATAAGPPVDLSELLDPEAVEYAPTCGAGVGALVFSGPDVEDPLLPAGSDAVRVAIGPGTTEQTVTGLFAPVALRAYRLANGTLVSIATITDQAGLDTARSETAWDIASQAPRLVRYSGLDSSAAIPFGTGQVALAAAAWDGALAWAGIGGAVATYYQTTVSRAIRGHLAKGPANLTPALYRQLTPGRTVLLLGGTYQLDAVNNYDLADEANQTSIELLRTL